MTSSALAAVRSAAGDGVTSPGLSFTLSVSFLLQPFRMTEAVGLVLLSPIAERLSRMDFELG